MKKKSVIKQIYDCLKSDFDTYFPTQHKGECVSPYIVVSGGGTVNLLSEQNLSSERPIYTIMIYVPKNNYSLLEEYAYNVKQTMKKIYPLVMYAGNETPTYYDEAIKGHMVSFQYQGIRKKNNR